MEQKGLDEIEESFLGEEIIEDEVSFMTETKTAKSAAKKTRGTKTSDAEQETVEQKAEKMEEVTISSVETVAESVVKKIKKPTVEEVAVAPVAPKTTTEPKVEAWGKDPAEPSGSNAWVILSGVLVVLLLVSVFTQGFSFGDNAATPGEEIGLTAAELLVQDYVNTNLLPDPFTAGLVSSEELGDLYKVTLTVNGQEIDSYITKSGDLFFPQGLEIDGTIDNTGTGAELEAVDRVEVSTDDDAVKGDVNAPVTIVEFSDYECPFCGKFYAETYSLIVENYIDTGIVKLAFRDFPLSFHPQAEGAAIAAECAGEQDAYFAMHDLLFENQAALSEELYLALAEDLALDVDEFTTCLADPAIAAEVAADQADGTAYGVSGTPGFFINGELISGAQPYEVFVAAIDRALAELSAGESEVVAEEVVEVVVEEVAAEEDIEVVADDTEDSMAEEVVAEEVVTTGDTVSVELTAKKWRFTPSEVSISAGDTVELTVIPTDLNGFTFSIPAFGVEELISGETLISFTVSETGSFEYSCSSCEEWRGMTGTLVVE